MLALIRTLRLPNLIIVFLTQYIPYWFVLRPAILKAGGIPALTEQTFLYISAATILVTYAGYVLNDYYDRSIDLVNKPKRVVWGKILPANLALLLYGAVVTAAHILAFFLDQQINPANRWPLWLFPSISFLLFLYAWQMKCTAILGNLLVSVLCGMVPIILLLPEERAIWLCSHYRPEAMHQAIGMIWTYGLFAFLTNLLREQIKDMEDFEGDSACGCMTLAASRGIYYARKPAAATAFTLSVLTAFLLFFWQQTGVPDWQLFAGAGGLLLPALFVMFFLARAKNKKDFKIASALVKLIMLLGLFLLIRYS
jgi:4-hydroxybenzoate polyprenyltransferase